MNGGIVSQYTIILTSKRISSIFTLMSSPSSLTSWSEISTVFVFFLRFEEGLLQLLTSLSTLLRLAFLYSTPCPTLFDCDFVDCAGIGPSLSCTPTLRNAPSSLILLQGIGRSWRRGVFNKSIASFKYLDLGTPRRFLSVSWISNCGQ
jgi:hypothetical protein